jgi:hypothetical protein
MDHVGHQGGTVPQPMVSSTPSTSRKTPWYFIAILTFFIFPIIWLWRSLKKENYPAFFGTLGMVMVLGYAWSYLVSASRWWVFNPACMLGVLVLPNLPLEEVLFYPLGGALSILVYQKLKSRNRSTQRAGLGTFWLLAGLTAAAVGAIFIAQAQHGRWAYYLISQVVLFNGLTLILWWVPRARFFVWPAALAVLGMTVIGFAWNWLAFTQGWWTYYAILGWMFPPRVPVDDWNFYIFAPLAAISLYGLLERPESPR